MPGPLTQSPLSGAFWRQMGSGMRDTVFAPIARDAMAGHQSLRQNYPLPYEVAQVAVPPIGIAAAGMDYAEAAGNNDSQGMARAALSAIQVVGRNFRVGNGAPSLRQAVSAVPQQQVHSSHHIGLKGSMLWRTSSLITTSTRTNGMATASHIASTGQMS